MCPNSHGRLIIVDWGCPDDQLMRLAFLAVQLIDGFANARQRAAGELPRLIRHSGLQGREGDKIRTVWGELERLAATPDPQLTRGGSMHSKIAEVAS